ncbi:uncharacterized protein LOC117604674 [Osmia lignaria lignaria]|uniref:uncharacterized protein LOC114872366 n=1 Tax=Osmia bicornis bicornis TaxID=1437191 RepID=UPI0014782D81|nr:uncharacterized protein LOC114872366 [Osmia bicornis bicornis]XP_034180920.1 uncharacterized protein LOC117604674 [Osmia lignaria]
MNRKFLYAAALLAFLLLLQQPTESKKVIVHVPYRVKNLKHTHTIYVVIPHYDEKEEDSKEDEKLED